LQEKGWVDDKTIYQVLIKERIGLTFPVVLRSILRQDPDVIMLGEIRDVETAEVAFHAALTGHLVYSTLHTNAALATIARLFDLELKPFVIASAIEGIIAQRLTRRLCESCKEPAAPKTEILARLGPAFTQIPPAQVFQSKGCTYCNGTGYKGRVGLYEVLVLDDDLRELIANRAGLREMLTRAREIGFRTMIEDARDKVDHGLTTLEEILRVLGPQ
jgi:type II secretory ATPase GspE/PulE/Tfp pilus assembly ATPase PilB-like protein